ncbi:U1 zinc finger-domain-containing protein [Lipomyces orientalis]|uniref:U1 zinc finger-domain-containing protein n=1 Tax=Lipomyces orientalis TaxID=1233043 RepID=A0ACC3TFM0_9ASCO
MPKYFCDYCDVYLTHDSISVRRAHNSGRNHIKNVIDYYQKISQEQAQAIIDSITSQYSDENPAGQVSRSALPYQFPSGVIPPPPVLPGMPVPPPGSLPIPPPGGLPLPPPGGFPIPPPGMMIPPPGGFSGAANIPIPPPGSLPVPPPGALPIPPPGFVPPGLSSTVPAGAPGLSSSGPGAPPGLGFPPSRGYMPPGLPTGAPGTGAPGTQPRR